MRVVIPDRIIQGATICRIRAIPGIFSLLVLSGLFITPGAAAYQSISIGAHYLSGDYGDCVDTRMWYAPVTIKHRDKDWMLQLTLSWLKLEGPGNVVGGVREPLTSGENVGAVSEQGLGDALLKGSYTLHADYKNQRLLDLLFKWKIPVADESKGLGTGQDDFSLQLDLAQRWQAYTGFASIGYKQRGDGTVEREYNLPEGRRLLTEQLSLNDGWYYSLGASWHYHRHKQLGVVWDYTESANSDNAAIQEMMLFAQWRYDSHWSLMTYIGRGFTRNSSDGTIGVQSSYRF